MSAPIFSIDPKDYDKLEQVVIKAGYTPVLVVIGGSYATGQIHDKSDLDIWGVYLEDEPAEFSVNEVDRLSILGNSGWTQIIFFSLKTVREQIRDPYTINDPPRRIWHYENFMVYPRIYDSQHAKDFREELSVYTSSEVAQWYLEAGNWFEKMVNRSPKMAERALRLYLTGCRLIETEELVVKYQDLLDWSRISDLIKARERLVTDLGV